MPSAWPYSMALRLSQRREALRPHRPPKVRLSPCRKHSHNLAHFPTPPATPSAKAGNRAYGRGCPLWSLAGSGSRDAIVSARPLEIADELARRQDMALHRGEQRGAVGLGRIQRQRRIQRIDLAVIGVRAASGSPHFSTCPGICDLNANTARSLPTCLAMLS